MEIITHQAINKKLCGTPISLEKGSSRVEFIGTDDMVADASGLIHGGFIFGLADYAAMIAVNHPNVVLGAANIKFLKPVCLGETIIAEALVTKQADQKKQTVNVSIYRDQEKVFIGEFTCFILKKHVLHISED